MKLHNDFLECLRYMLPTEVTTLLAFILEADEEGRFTIDRAKLTQQTTYGTLAIDHAIDWLKRHKAIERAGSNGIYKLTGTLYLYGKPYQYLAKD